MKIGNMEIHGAIYKITNKINGKVYIGQTTVNKGFNGRYNRCGVDIERVYNYYVYCKEKNRDYNVSLFNSIHKHGFGNFEVNKILDVAFSKKELDIKECFYIELYDSINKGFNHTCGGSGTKNFTSYNANNVVAFGDEFEFHFVSKKKGAEYFGIKSDCTIGQCCRGEISYCGKYNNKKIIWRELECYKKYQSLTRKNLLNILILEK